MKITRLSCPRFRRNEVRLALSLPAYNLGNLCRRLALPEEIENLKRARYYWLLSGRELSRPAAVWGDAGADRVPAGSDGIGDAGPVCRRIGLSPMGRG